MEETTSAKLALLVRRAQELDPAAFDALVELYGPRLYGFFYRWTGRREEAEDLLQEVFLRIVRRLPDYVHDGRFEAWLFRIAANLGRDWIRRLRRTPPTATLAGYPGDDGQAADSAYLPRDTRTGSPEQPLIRREEVGRLQRALQQLGEAEREVVMLRHYGELSFAEIADLMSTPIGTALARGHRGLAKLRRMMESE